MLQDEIGKIVLRQGHWTIDHANTLKAAIVLVSAWLPSIVLSLDRTFEWLEKTFRVADKSPQM